MYAYPMLSIVETTAIEYGQQHQFKKSRRTWKSSSQSAFSLPSTNEKKSMHGSVIGKCANMAWQLDVIYQQLLNDYLQQSPVCSSN